MSFGLLLLVTALPAQAQIYACDLPDGTKLFTNQPPDRKTCKMIDSTPASGSGTATAPAAPGNGKLKSPPVATPSSFPRVDRALQRERDNDRRRILETELGTEERLLDQAKKELSEQESVRRADEKNYQRVLERIEPFRKKVRQHEDNVANLRREISKMR
jgi:hypothetical protein